MTSENHPDFEGQKLRVLVADDERPARSYLVSLLRALPDVEIAGEAATGPEAVELIESLKPDLALLDLQMPELDGLGVVSRIERDALPLVAFVTAYDEYAVRAFELNAIDYLLKPVAAARLAETIRRAVQRLERLEPEMPSPPGPAERQRLREAAADYDLMRTQGPAPYLDRIPVRQREEFVIVPVDQVASIVADGELLHLSTIDGRRMTFSHRLKDLEQRLDPAKFVRLGRGALASISQIARVNPMPGGTYVVTLRNNQQLNVSRIQARHLREQLLRL